MVLTIEVCRYTSENKAFRGVKIEIVNMDCAIQSTQSGHNPVMVDRPVLKTT